MGAIAIVAFLPPPSIAQAVNRPSAACGVAALLTATATPPGAGHRLPVLVDGDRYSAHPVNLAKPRAARARSAVSRVSCRHMIWHFRAAAAAMMWGQPPAQLETLEDTIVRGCLVCLGLHGACTGSASGDFCAPPMSPSWCGCRGWLPALRLSRGIATGGVDASRSRARRHV